MQNRILALGLLTLILTAGLWGCGKEHSPLSFDAFPALLLDVKITGDESLELSWDWDDESTEWFMLYLGAFALDEYDNIVEIDSLIDSTETSPVNLLVENLTEYNEELGDTLFKFIFFRVAPKSGGIEGLRSPMAFPHW